MITNRQKYPLYAKLSSSYYSFPHSSSSSSFRSYSFITQFYNRRVEVIQKSNDDDDDGVVETVKKIVAIINPINLSTFKHLNFTFIEASF